MEFKASTMTGLMLIICIVAVLVNQGNAMCISCNKRACVEPTGCKYGITTDMCYCCNVCAKGPGEDCGGFGESAGKCGKGLKCSVSSSEETGKCIEEGKDKPE